MDRSRPDPPPGRAPACCHRRNDGAGRLRAAPGTSTAIHHDDQLSVACQRAQIVHSGLAVFNILDIREESEADVPQVVTPLHVAGVVPWFHLARSGPGWSASQVFRMARRNPSIVAPRSLALIIALVAPVPAAPAWITSPAS